MEARAGLDAVSGNGASALMVRWRISATPPLSGSENMAVDRQALAEVAAGRQSPTLRFFRWSTPTLSYGRLQQAAAIAPLVLPGWELVQRPTGGGIVRHDNDLCFSLTWPDHCAPMPARPSEAYAFIHGVVQTALAPVCHLELADCDAHAEEPFEHRQCFSNPVPYDLMQGSHKIVGGAIARQRGATLYQGSIQSVDAHTAEPLLAEAFQRLLTSPTAVPATV